MKTTAVVVAILMMAAVAFAAEFEIDKGAIMLGGMVSFENKGGDLYKFTEYNAKYDSVGELTQTILTFQPEMLYFVTKGLGIGGQVIFASDNNYGYSEDKLTTFGIGPEIKYYFGNADSKMFPFIGAGFAYVSNSIGHQVDSKDDFKITGTTIEVTGGAFFKLVDHFGIQGAAFINLDSFKRGLSDNEKAANYKEPDSQSGTVIGLKIGVTGFLY